MLPLFVLRKERSKIRKILLRTLLFVVFFSSILAVLTRNKWVQTKLAQYITEQVQTQLGVEVEIKAVEIDFLRNFHLEGILMRDLHKDTFLYVRTLNAQLQNWNLTQNAFDLNSIELFAPLVKMGQYESDSLLNYEEIFARLPKDTQTSKPVRLIFEGIALKNGTFVFFDGEEAFRKNITGEFNPSYLRYQEINAQIPKGRMEYDGSDRKSVV